VSGVAALLLERNPSLTSAQVCKVLRDTAKDLGPNGRDRHFLARASSTRISHAAKRRIVSPGKSRLANDNRRGDSRYGGLVTVPCCRQSDREPSDGARSSPVFVTAKLFGFSPRCQSSHMRQYAASMCRRNRSVSNNGQVARFSASLSR